ncbi:phage tail tape measure protein [Morganella morganii]|uniref:phage tail tape measure protein n=1 Tax=Morganella morganii TaxID=582 RepID=UPI003864EE93
MAGALGRLNIDMTLNTAKFTSAMSRTQHQTEKFSQSTRSSLQSIVRQQELIASQTAKTASMLTNFGMAVSGALSVRQIVNYADSWTGLQNRLKLVTNGSQELARATNDVYDIAQRTRQSLDSTTQVYQRFADNAERLGLNQQRVASLTDTVSKAVAISGASAASAEAALVQFGQALASGQLRGQELNSVMEQTPGLARAIADGMGVSIGQLRKMAADGNTSIEQIITALERAKSGVDQKFATSTATVSQSFTNLQSAITKYVGEANNSSGATQVLTAGLSGLANNLGGVVKVTEALAVTAIVVKMTKWTQATYAQAAATRVKIQQDLLSAEATQAKAASELGFARSSMASLQAQLKLAQTETQRNLIRAQIRAQAAGIIGAVNAETLATQRLNAAKAASSRMSRGLSGALSILGGPVGIATGLLTAGAMAWYEWSEHTEQAKQKSLEFAESLDVTAEALRKLNTIDRQNAIVQMSKALDVLREKGKQQADEVRKNSATVNRRFVAGIGGPMIVESPRTEQESKQALEKASAARKAQADLERQFAENKAKYITLMHEERRSVGMVSATYATFNKYLADSSSVSDGMISKLHMQGSAYDNLTASIHQAAQAQQQFSAQSLVVVSDAAQKSIDLSNRAIAKANAKGRELARLTAEDMLVSRKITPDMPGYDKALDAEISAQMALQEKRNTRTPRKSKVDYKKQYTDMVSEMENKLSSLIADGKSIREYGTTSSFKEYDSLMADITRNQEKFSHFGKEATDKLKAQAKAIDEVAQANAVATMSYDRTKEIEQLRFETELTGKSRTEQERLTYFRQLDLQVQQMRVGMSDKNIAVLEAETQKIREQYAEWQKQSELLRQSPAEGFKAGLKDFGDSATDVMGNVRNITTGALTNMTDTLNTFVMTGKASFGDFARSVLSDISKMLLKMALFNAVKAGGSAMGFSMDWMSNGHAYGGYTGHGGKFEPKGIVHGGEFVFTKEATARLGIDNLYRLMNSAKGYASGGYVGDRMPAVVSKHSLPAIGGGVNMPVIIGDIHFENAGNQNSGAGIDTAGIKRQLKSEIVSVISDQVQRPGTPLWNAMKGGR